MLFARSTDVRKGKGTFVESTFTNFKKAYEMCDTHSDRHYHKDAAVFCDGFVERISGRRESVAVQLSRDMRLSIQTNRKKLCSIVETIVLCGRQNIPLRGHCDNGTDHVEGVQSTTSNHRNFLALLNFRISSGDTILKEHLQLAGGKAIYTSTDIQNQIIKTIDHIHDTILNRVCRSLCYALLGDEITDYSNKE